LLFQSVWFSLRIYNMLVFDILQTVNILYLT
jgi:hypothetical protein